MALPRSALVNELANELSSHQLPVEMVEMQDAAELLGGTGWARLASKSACGFALLSPF